MECWTRVDKSTTTSSRVIAHDGGKAYELLEGGVHAEFGLLHTGDQHLVTLKEDLQLCVAVLDAVAIELQKPASFKGRSWRDGAHPDRWARSDGEGPLGEGVPGREGRTSTCRRTPTPLWVLQVGPKWSMWGSSKGPAAGSLLKNVYTQAVYTPDYHKLSMGLRRGLGMVQTPPDKEAEEVKKEAHREHSFLGWKKRGTEEEEAEGLLESEAHLSKRVGPDQKVGGAALSWASPRSKSEMRWVSGGDVNVISEVSLRMRWRHLADCCRVQPPRRGVVFGWDGPLNRGICEYFILV